jgi:hypothetical protein
MFAGGHASQSAGTSSIMHTSACPRVMPSVPTVFIVDPYRASQLQSIHEVGGIHEVAAMRAAGKTVWSLSLWSAEQSMRCVCGQQWSSTNPTSQQRPGPVVRRQAQATCLNTTTDATSCGGASPARAPARRAAQWSRFSAARTSCIRRFSPLEIALAVCDGVLQIL